MQWRRQIRGVAAIVAIAACAGWSLAAELPENFRMEPVISGLTEPSSLAVVPDGSLLITERTTGDLRVVRGGVLQSAPVCTVAVDSTGDAGLLGVAVHPQFASNHWIYLYYTSSANGKNRVQRFVLEGGACSFPVDIFTDLGAGASFERNGGGIAFGPDGKLYVATGDVETSSNGQSDAVLMAKVLRVNDDGSLPDDNPTAGSFVYAKGVRDGRGVVVGDNGKVYLSDAGSTTDSSDDEINAVPAGGNLGWDAATGNSGGAYDDPLVSWSTPIGTGGLAFYAANAFPDAAADGLDNDLDAFGPDRFPGVYRQDDNAKGVCVGSDNYNQPCTSDADCPPRTQPFFTEDSFCDMRDEKAELCDGGATGDDDCDAEGGAGIDEPDESFVNNLFAAADEKIVRVVTKGADHDQYSSDSDFFDSTFLADCPTGFTDVAAGDDGFLYVTALNGGGSGGGLYRVVFDDTAGPREVSQPGSPFPLRVERAAGNDVWVYWEDLRSDALQPRDDGTDPSRPEREYTVWMGDLGNFTSHTAVSGLDATAGDAVNDAVRRAQVAAGEGNHYFLVSGRGDNLEGTLGFDSSGAERTGYSVTDLCESIGYHESPTYDLWKCGQDFSLVDEHGEERSLYEYRGHPVLIDLSAIWCGPCQAEADVLETLYEDYRDRGVKILSVLADENNNFVDWVGRPGPAECRTWGDRDDPNPDHQFPCVGDQNPPEGQQQKAWPKYNKHNAFPTNVVLDNGLRVVYSGAGYNESRIRELFDLMVGTTDTCLP